MNIYPSQLNSYVPRFVCFSFGITHNYINYNDSLLNRLGQFYSILSAKSLFQWWYNFFYCSRVPRGLCLLCSTDFLLVCIRCFCSFVISLCAGLSFLWSRPSLLLFSVGFSFCLCWLFTMYLFILYQIFFACVRMYPTCYSFLFPLDFVCCLVVLLERLLLPSARWFIIQFIEYYPIQNVCVSLQCILLLPFRPLSDMWPLQYVSTIFSDTFPLVHMIEEPECILWSIMFTYVRILLLLLQFSISSRKSGRNGNIYINHLLILKR